jgi:hypothetical protein
MTTMAYYEQGAAAYDRMMSRWSRLDIPALLLAAEVTGERTERAGAGAHVSQTASS